MTEDYFVHVPNARAIELQRLQVARRLLLCSGSYLAFQALRDKKAAHIKQLKTQIESVSSLFSDLEDLLPHKELALQVTKTPVSSLKEESIPSHPVHAASLPESISKFDTLKEALALIEKKIKSLDL